MTRTLADALELHKLERELERKRRELEDLRAQERKHQRELNAAAAFVAWFENAYAFSPDAFVVTARERGLDDFVITFSHNGARIEVVGLVGIDVDAGKVRPPFSLAWRYFVAGSGNYYEYSCFLDAALALLESEAEAGNA